MFKIYRNSLIFLILFIPILVSIRYFHSFTLFHNLVDLFTVFVGVSTFVMANITNKYTHNNFLIFIGIGYLWIGIQGLINTIIYDVNIEIDNIANIDKIIIFAMFSRIFEAITLFLSVLFLTKKRVFTYSQIFLLFGTIFFIFGLYLLAYIFNYVDNFFISHITNYGILSILLYTIYLYAKNRKLFSSESIYLLFILAVTFTTLSQISIMFSEDLGDSADFISNILKISSFWLIFYGAVVLGIERPFRLMENNENLEKLENLLKEDEKMIKLYEDIFVNTNNGILVSDKNNQIIKVNSAFSRITGYSDSEAMNKTPKMLKSGRQSKEFYAEMWKDLNEKSCWSGEVWNKSKDGTVYPQWLSINVIRDLKTMQINYFISNFSDISVLKESQDALEYMAHHDGLTGLVNRILLKSHLDNMIKSRKRDNKVGAVLFLDLDKFKFVNDTYGHSAGDTLLQDVSKRLLALVRSSDIVGRVGGDEFIILLSNVSSKENIRVIANKIVQEISRDFLNIVEQPINIGTSVGIAIFPEQSDSVEELIKYSDIAMFESKNNGRNSYTFYESGMKEMIVENNSIEVDLKSAILGDEFLLHYQPQIDSFSKKVISAEALIRWKHPRLGFMHPVHFIDIAEESEMIIDIGKWVLFQACSQIVHWRKNGVMIEKISVNISTIQFLKTDMVETVSATLKKTNCDANLLEIEITESVLIDNKESMFKTLNILKNMGVEFAIDDFGTGYSSLLYLKQLPFNTIKIDKSFVMETPHNENDVAITKSVIALGKSFNYKVVAEGVETVEQLEFLKALQCDLIQGFYYAKPMSADDFTTFYRDKNLSIKDKS